MIWTVLSAPQHVGLVGEVCFITCTVLDLPFIYPFDVVVKSHEFVDDGVNDGRVNIVTSSKNSLGLCMCWQPLRPRMSCLSC